MNVPNINKFKGNFHVLSDTCTLGHREEDSENEWYIWFTPNRGESRTFVVDTVSEGLDIGNTVEINGATYRVDDIDIRKRNKKGKITLTLI